MGKLQTRRGDTARMLATVSFGALFALSSPSALAQEASTASEPAAAIDGGSEIIVTANRREESAQKVGISVTAVAPQALENANVLRAEDLAKLVPALGAIPNAGTAVTAFAIRGVSLPDASPHQEAPIAVYQDGVYIANAPAAGFPVFDMARVEVLRGPQGTLFGRNATGGLLQFISNKPEAGVSGQIEAGLGSYGLRQFEGFLNVGNDVIAARIAGTHIESDGYVENRIGKDLVSRNVDALRFQLQFTPTADTKLTLRLEGFNDHGTSYAGKHQAVYYPDGALFAMPLPANVDAYGTGPGNDIFGYRDNDPDPLSVAVDDPGEVYKDVKTAALNYEQALGDITFVSTSAYSRTKVRYREDSDDSPMTSIIYNDRSNVEQFSQELRLQDGTGPFRWTAGGYYFNVSGDYGGSFAVPAFFAASSTDYSVTTRSLAVFAQGEYELADRLTFILGGRYTWDKNRIDADTRCEETQPGWCDIIFPAFSSGDPLLLGALGQITDQQKSSDWSGKVGLNFQVTPSLLTYVSASKGLKGGNYTISPDGSTRIDAFGFDPETIYAYEAGVKSSWLNNRLTVNLTGYYYDYKDYQTFFFSGILASVFNRDATNKGFEFEATARPWQGANIGFNAAYSDFMVKNIATPRGIESQRPNNAPKWQVGWTAGQSFDLSPRLNLYLGYVGKYTGGRYFNIVNEPLVYDGAFTVHDLNAKLTIDEKYWISAFVTNLTDKRYATARFSQAPQGYGLTHYAEPRVIGVRAGVRF